ncbi:MAG: AMP-binding protein [Myxococcota bacterium]|nr:AMP-binding protein [Myxococcota bacterium]
MSAQTNPFWVDESKPWFRKESGWPDEVPKNIDFPKKTLHRFFKEAAAQWPDHNALWFLDTYMTYRELDDLIDRFATALHRIGVKKGDVVAMLLPNSFQYVIGYYAVTALGAVVSGINPTYKPMEVLHQLKVVGAKTLIVLDALYQPQVAPIRDKSPLTTIVATNIVDLAALSPLKKFLGRLLKKIPTGPTPADALRFSDMVRTEKAVPAVDIDPVEDAATYIMTGGTTGTPKAAVLTHFNCVSNAMQCRAWVIGIKTGAAMVGVLPLFHSFAMVAVMNASFTCGAWAMLFPKPPPMEDLVKTIIRIGPDRATYFCGAEILFKKIADMPNISEYPISGKLDLCISGAGPLHRPVQEAFERITGAKLVEGYGLTEASPVVSASPFWGDRKLGTIGLPFPGTDWKIMDAEAGTREMGTGQDQAGEICVAGPQVMKGYLDRPDETAETIRDIGGKKYLYTGDIGYMGSDGQITICDRKKQLIKYKGYSVYPKEVEELVGGHDAVSEAAVAGIPDPEAGELIKAWVVLKPEHKGKLAVKDLLKWCEANMTHYKQPRLIEFRDDLPKSLIGKVMRRELQEADPLYQERIAARKK